MYTTEQCKAKEKTALQHSIANFMTGVQNHQSEDQTLGFLGDVVYLAALVYGEEKVMKTIIERFR